MSADPSGDPTGDPTAASTVRSIRVVGTGLIGTSVALAARRAGIDVQLSDVDPDALSAAVEIGAGTAVDAVVAGGSSAPDLVVVAVPPHLVGRVLADQIAATGASTIVTDVASVKALPLRDLRTVAGDGDIGRYVGSHPMAGSERSGPWAARADLFDGATWAVVEHDSAAPAAAARVREFAERCGARVVELSAADHDEAVARVSHLPHLMAVMTASTLRDAPTAHLELSGQGVRDVTRIAGGDPRLWSQILTGNATALSGLLAQVRDRLDEVIAALDPTPGEVDGSDPVRRAADVSAPRVPDPGRIGEVLAAGVSGRARIPGKHGQPALLSASVTVVLSDAPGQLAAMFADVSDAGVNIEDFRVDHSPGRPVGHVELSVRPEVAEELVSTLAARGWIAHVGGSAER